MEPAMLRIGRKCRNLVPSVMALALAAVIGGASTTPTRAQEYDGNRGRDVHRGHDDSQRNRQRDRGQHAYRGEDPSDDRPAYVYAPPPVYYAPPPAPPVIDFVFPLRFR
jgi:hypothetical protein